MIAGLWYRDGAAATVAALENMLRASGASSVYATLWTPPMTGWAGDSAAPLVDAKTGLMIAADVRLDNRAELLGSLGVQPGDRFVPDAEVILRGYQTWGAECADRLTGDFAFVIWDAHRQEVFAARDCFGAKPLSYFIAPRLFAFCSGIPGVLATESVSRRVRDSHAAAYLRGAVPDAASTFYRDVHRLPPGCWMRIDARGVAVERYWKPDADRELDHASSEEYALRFRQLFRAAVGARLRTATRVGSMLSGGLDSSSITCMASDLNTGAAGSLHTFSLLFDDLPQCDERRFIASVVRSRRISASYVRGDLLDPLRDVDRTLHAIGEPYYAPNLFLHCGLYESAARAGVGTLLDGFDGDCVVSHGLRRLAELARAMHWIELAREGRRTARRLGRPAGALLLNHVVRPYAPRALRRSRILRGIAASRLLNALSEDSRQRPHALGEGVTERASHRHRLMSPVAAFALEAADRAAAMFRVEPRYPFFDRRLAEYCLALPSDQKLKNGWTRLVLRRAMEGMLPSDVQWRPDKSDLGRNFVRRLANGRDRIQAEVGRPDAGVDAYIDRQAWREAHSRCREGSRSTDAVAAWRGFVFARWLRNGAAC